MEKNIGVSIKSFDTHFINWLLYSPKKALTGKLSVPQFLHQKDRKAIFVASHFIGFQDLLK